MIQAVGVDVAAGRVLWIKASPEFELLFQLLDKLKMDEERRFWIAYPDAIEIGNGIEEDKGQGETEVKTFSGVSHNVLTRVEENVQ